ncbi:MAG: hypothetical protein ABI310_05530, partial [Microbacteriaceae bacterium]
MSVSAFRAGLLRGWRVRIASRRLFRQRRVLLLVLTVAVLASTALASGGLLVTATEQSAIRTSLVKLPVSETTMSVFVEQPRQNLARVSAAAGEAIHSILGREATASASLYAYSVPVPAIAPGDTTAMGYFGQLNSVASHVKLTAGVLPTARPSAGTTTLDIAVPALAAGPLGLHVGSTVILAGSTPVTLRVVGIYTPVQPTADYWSQDPLRASGNNPQYLSPTGSPPSAVDEFGPMLVPPGSLDAIGVAADRVAIDY